LSIFAKSILTPQNTLLDPFTDEQLFKLVRARAKNFNGAAEMSPLHISETCHSGASRACDQKCCTGLVTGQSTAPSRGVILNLRMTISIKPASETIAFFTLERTIKTQW